MFSVCVIALIPTSMCEAQNFNWNYGEGIHKYFAGNSSESIQALDAAIAEKSNDPRPYYFRGLARMRCGDSYGAMSDYQMASQIEALGKRRSPAVARALERVQGAERLYLEKIRTAAFRPAMISQSYPSCPCGVIPCGCASKTKMPQNFAFPTPVQSNQFSGTSVHQSVQQPNITAANPPQLSGPGAVSAPPIAEPPALESTQVLNPTATPVPNSATNEGDQIPFGIDVSIVKPASEATTPQTPSEDLFPELGALIENAPKDSSDK